jgi:hypothetical protein
MSTRKRIMTVDLERHWSIYAAIADTLPHIHPERIPDDQAMALGVAWVDEWRVAPQTVSVIAVVFSDKW